MDTRSGIIDIISLSRTECIILFRGKSINAATLWNSHQNLSSSELNLRRMWLSLATKAMAEKWEVQVSVDSAGLATGILVVDNSTMRIRSLNTNNRRKVKLVQKPLNQQKLVVA
jgi:hypothetical protein